MWPRDYPLQLSTCTLANWLAKERLKCSDRTLRNVLSRERRAREVSKTESNNQHCGAPTQSGHDKSGRTLLSAIAQPKYQQALASRYLPLKARRHLNAARGREGVKGATASHQQGRNGRGNPRVHENSLQRDTPGALRTITEGKKPKCRTRARGRAKAPLLCTSRAK